MFNLGKPQKKFFSLNGRAYPPPPTSSFMAVGTVEKMDTKKNFFLNGRPLREALFSFCGFPYSSKYRFVL